MAIAQSARCLVDETRAVAWFRASRQISKKQKRAAHSYVRARKARGGKYIKVAVTPAEKRIKLRRKKRRNDIAVARVRAKARVYNGKDKISRALATLTDAERAALVANPSVISAVEKLLEALLFKFS